MSKFVKAVAGPRNSVVYTDEEGNQFKASGGARSLRNNNPGNLVTGEISKRNGQIGTAGGFAVFPDYETGHKALIDSLKNMHGDKDLKQMIRVYAPSFENDTEGYLKHLRKVTGVKGDKKIKNFTPEEFEKLIDAVEKMEGIKKPTLTPLPKKKVISMVRKNKKGTITAYYVEEIGWFSKEEGIQLAVDEEIDVVVAISRSGHPYLRTRPDVAIENNLENMG